MAEHAQRFGVTLPCCVESVHLYTDGMASQSPALTALSRELQRRQTVRIFSEGHWSTGVSALDRLLPHHGLKAGGITEFLSCAAAGGFTFALLAAKEALRSCDNGVVVVIDRNRQCYPASFPGWGIPLERLALIRPKTSADVLWAWEQSLRCRGIVACLGWLPDVPVVALRRLQVAAEHGGGMGLLVRPLKTMNGSSWADVRWRVTPLPLHVPAARPGPLRGRRFRVELIRCRNHMGGGVADVEFYPHAANPLRALPSLADPAVALRATGS